MQRSSPLFYIIVGIIIFGSVAIFATTLTHALIAPPTEQEIQVPQSKTVAEVASSTKPARLIIPSIGVDANVQYVGISKHGTMAVPTNYTDVGWYRYGAVPGRAGSAVMAGHLDNGFGLAGVFKRLDELKIGDEIVVLDQSGKRMHFKVVNTGVLDSSTNDTEKVFGGDSSTSRLNIITCEGTWQPEKKSYSERRIVYSVLDYVE